MAVTDKTTGSAGPDETTRLRDRAAGDGQPEMPSDAAELIGDASGGAIASALTSASADGANQLIPGACVAGGRYRLLLSHGGPHGLQFWQALDTTLHRQVALTFVNADGALDDDDIQKIVSHTVRLSRLDVPGIARVLHVIRTGPGALVVAEWIRGASLREVAATAPSPLGAARAMESLLAAAEAAHGAGLAMSIDHPSRVRVSVEGHVALTFPATMPDATPDADVQGLGAVLYALLVNRWPLDESGQPSGLASAEPDTEVRPKEPAAIDPDIPFLISAATTSSVRACGAIRSAAMLRSLLQRATIESDDAEPSPARATPSPRPRTTVSAAWWRARWPMEATRAGGRKGLLLGAGAGAAMIAVVLLVLASALSRIAGNGGAGISLDKDRLGLHSASAPPPTKAAPSAPGHGVKPVQATVFSPGGGADNPQSAGLAIDDNPATAWSTDIYFDAVPFPGFKSGVGLLLKLPQPTSLAAVTVDLDSTGTVVQIRSSPTATPAKLTDTVELTPPTPLRPGHNAIPVNVRTPTSNVLVWISTLGSTGGKSRADVSEISVQPAT